MHESMRFLKETLWKKVYKIFKMFTKGSYSIAIITMSTETII